MVIILLCAALIIYVIVVTLLFNISNIRMCFLQLEADRAMVDFRKQGILADLKALRKEQQ